MLRQTKIRNMIQRAMLIWIFLPLNILAMTYGYAENYGLQVGWQTDDRVAITTGIVEYGYTQQLCFYASSTQAATANHRQLYATGYKLKDATRYLSYYPYRWVADFNATAVALSYTGQQQTASNSTAHLAHYDYCAAAATPANDACTFSYRHLGAFLRITFTVPEGTAPTATLTLHPSGSLPSPSGSQPSPSDVLASPSDVLASPSGSLPSPSDVLASPSDVLASTFRVEGSLPTAQTLNLLAQGTDAELITTATGALSIALGALTPGTLYTAYMAMPQADLSSENIIIKLGDTPLATIKGFNAKQGCLYDIDLTPHAASRAMASHDAPALPLPTTRAAVANPIAQIPDILLDPDYHPYEEPQPEPPAPQPDEGSHLVNGAYVPHGATLPHKTIVIQNGKKFLTK